MDAFEQAISLPIHRHMSLNDVDRVVDALTDAMANLKGQAVS
jgi:dTDP-4-amino-4,6-dideoxygalactose transaminase